MYGLRRFAVTAALVLATAQQALALSTADLAKRARVLERHRGDGQKPSFNDPVLAKRADQYLTDASRKFKVDGTNFPLVPFDIGESYAGLLPISSSKNETRELFFWFFPSSNPAAKDEITIWLNGGPGCSSLAGLLVENGPFLWQPGTLAPTPNPYAWTNLTNTVWIEQPVGVGYDQGTPNITNDNQLADQFTGFWKNFVDTFGLYNYKTYITGESYAGYYVPYISNGFILKNDTKYFNLAGALINDPTIGDPVNQFEVIISPFMDYWKDVLYLNKTFTDQVHSLHKSCGYQAYLDKYFTFPPPKGPFPSLPVSDTQGQCDLQDAVVAAATLVNPCFNVYHITDYCPFTYLVAGALNDDNYSPPGAQVYFNRTDVKRALHVPVNTDWMICTNEAVYVPDDDDNTPGAAQDGVLARVVEHTNNVMVGEGMLDILLSVNGTLLAIQNMTWNGQQGLSKYPSNTLYVPYHPEYNYGALAGAGEAGFWRKERGLTFYTAHLAGHLIPYYAPGVAYRALEVLLGRISDLSNTSDFSTQKGTFTGSTPVLAGQSSFLNRLRHGGSV